MEKADEGMGENVFVDGRLQVDLKVEISVKI